jgi:hypothetical protein
MFKKAASPRLLSVQVTQGVHRPESTLLRPPPPFHRPSCAAQLLTGVGRVQKVDTNVSYLDLLLDGVVLSRVRAGKGKAASKTGIESPPIVTG